MVDEQKKRDEEDSERLKLKNAYQKIHAWLDEISTGAEWKHYGVGLWTSLGHQASQTVSLWAGRFFGGILGDMLHSETMFMSLVAVTEKGDLYIAPLGETVGISPERIISAAVDKTAILKTVLTPTNISIDHEDNLVVRGLQDGKSITLSFPACFIDGNEKLPALLASTGTVTQQKEESPAAPHSDPECDDPDYQPGNSVLETFMVKTRSAWMAGYLDPLNKICAQEARTNSLGAFIDMHRKYEEAILRANRLRAFEKDEFLVGLEEEDFFLTSKALYFFKPEEQVILLRDIRQYQSKGIWSLTLEITMNSGEKRTLSNMDSLPEDRYIQYLREHSYAETNDSMGPPILELPETKASPADELDANDEMAASEPTASPVENEKQSDDTLFSPESDRTPDASARNAQPHQAYSDFTFDPATFGIILGLMIALGAICAIGWGWYLYPVLDDATMFFGGLFLGILCLTGVGLVFSELRSKTRERKLMKQRLVETNDLAILTKTVVQAPDGNVILPRKFGLQVKRHRLPTVELTALDEIAVSESTVLPAESVNPPDDTPPSPVYLAAEAGDVGAVRALLEKGIDTNIKTSGGVTALMGAAAGGHVAVVDLLLANGADVNAQAKPGHSALYFAAQSGHAGIVRELLQKGANVDMQTKWGATPLQVAAQQGHREVTEILLEYGASVDMNAQFVPRAAVIAMHEHHTELVELLTAATPGLVRMDGLSYLGTLGDDQLPIGEALLVGGQLTISNKRSRPRKEDGVDSRQPESEAHEGQASMFVFDYNRMSDTYGFDVFRAIEEGLKGSRGACAFLDGDLEVAAGGVSGVPSLLMEIRDNGWLIGSSRTNSTLIVLASLNHLYGYVVAMWTNNSKTTDLLDQHLAAKFPDAYLGFLRYTKFLELPGFHDIFKPLQLPVRATYVDGKEQVS